ncbi:MAG: hypothetical protein ABI333_07280 [bacterium]
MAYNNNTTRLAILLLSALGLAACGRPLGIWNRNDSNHHNSNYNWNSNYNFNHNWNSNFNHNGNGNNNNGVNHPPLAICPEPLYSAPNRLVELMGDGDDDFGIVSWRWQVVSAPPGSTAAPSPPDVPITTFTPDMVGDFTLRLTVRDGGGLEASCQTLVQSRVSTPLAICPGDMTIPTRTETLLYGDGLDEDGWIVGWSWEVVTHNTDTDPELGSPNSQDTTFWALRVGQYLMRLTVEDDHGLTHYCQFTITTTPTGPTAICPDDINTVPLVTINWTGNGEDDGFIVSYQWQMLTQPSGSAASPPAPANGQTVSFEPDVVGVYLMRLTVTDNDNNTDSCQFSVFATPGEGLRIELFWNPPESPQDNSDVDLHLLHPTGTGWFNQQTDCFYSNCNVSNGHHLYWDAPNYFPDDPRLDLDDVDGFGPENINIDEPVVGNAYRVGVHYFNDDGYGPASIHVKIYCGTISINPVWEYGPKILTGGSGSSWDNDFWKVATVTWNGFTCNVTPINQVVTANQAQSSP